MIDNLFTVRDNLFTVRVRVREVPEPFSHLLPGRCFVLAESTAVVEEGDLSIWIKLDKNRAQYIHDSNVRQRIESVRPVCKAILVVEPFCFFTKG